MNTGRTLETRCLLLLPGSNARDSAPFLQILRENGDFRMFCGVDFSEDRLWSFSDYFERFGNDECIYSVFEKEAPERFIGYVGFHREEHYELEFYISKPYRSRGYCTEAARAAVGQLFGEGLSVDGAVLTEDRLYSSTIADNIPTVRVLEKLGFKRNTPEDGPVLLMVGFIDEGGNFTENSVAEYVLAKEDKLAQQ